MRRPGVIWLKESDIVITATTSATPVLPDDAALYAGKCLIGVGLSP
ncbi:MAG: hypothetical protein ACLUEQ_09655 [Cloacibacillus evryensis]